MKKKVKRGELEKKVILKKKEKINEKKEKKEKIGTKK